MIEFATVSKEFRSLVHRRKLLMTFLGSLFAASALFLHNSLRDDLHPSLEPVKSYIFAFYAVMVMVPTLILALRMARLHAGLTLNGVLYAGLMQHQDFTPPSDPQRAARLNPFSVSFLQFLLMDLFAGASATLLAIALDAHLIVSAGVGLGVFTLWLLWFLRTQHKAAVFALEKIKTDSCAPFERKEWRDHVSQSLEDANTGLMADLGFVGLIMFSVVEKLTGLRQIKPETAGPAFDDIQKFGPWVYASLMLVTGLFGLIVHLRVRVAIGSLSLQLDPSDKPFRSLRLTDSLLGYMLMSFLFTVGLHLALTLLGLPVLVILGIDAVVFALAVAAEQCTLIVAGKKSLAATHSAAQGSAP